MEFPETFSNTLTQLLDCARVIPKAVDNPSGEVIDIFDFQAIREGSKRKEPLKVLLRSLDTDQLVLTQAVMYFGRGDFTSFDEAYAHCRGFFSTADACIDSMVEKASFADNLRRGIARLRNDGVNLDVVEEPVPHNRGCWCGRQVGWREDCATTLHESD